MATFSRPLSAFGLTLAAALAATVPTAGAVPVQAGIGSYNLGTDAAPGGTVAPSSSCGSGGQDSLIFTGSGANNIGIHSYSCGLGFFEFGSRSSGENTYYVDGTASVIGTLSTVGGFGFTISPGEVGAFGSTAFAVGEYQKSMLSVKLIIDGANLLDDTFTTMIGAGGVQTFSQISAGSDFSVAATLSTGAGFASYGIFGGSYFVPLTDGDHEISYVMSSLAQGRVNGTTSCRATLFSGGGIETAALVEGQVGGGVDGSFNSYCGAGARSGDPFPSAPIARALPEPGSLPLLGLAVGLLSLFSSRRFRKQAL